MTKPTYKQLEERCEKYKSEVVFLKAIVGNDVANEIIKLKKQISKLMITNGNNRQRNNKLRNQIRELRMKVAKLEND